MVLFATENHFSDFGKMVAEIKYQFVEANKMTYAT